MKATSALATLFANIEKEGKDLESCADSVLKIVKQAKITDVKEFSTAVKAAYAANGWNPTAGRPAKGEAPLKAVPTSVKQYVSNIRAAFRNKLLVSTYTSFRALRHDLQEHRAKARKAAAPKAPELVGIAVQKPDTLTGALFHDLVAVYDALEKSKQSKMIGALERVKRQFAPAVTLAALPSYIERVEREAA